MVGADVLIQFTFSSAKVYFQHAKNLLSAFCILSASLNPYHWDNTGSLQAVTGPSYENKHTNLSYFLDLVKPSKTRLIITTRRLKKGARSR